MATIIENINIILENILLVFIDPYPKLVDPNLPFYMYQEKFDTSRK